MILLISLQSECPENFEFNTSTKVCYCIVNYMEVDAKCVKCPDDSATQFGLSCNCKDYLAYFNYENFVCECYYSYKQNSVCKKCPEKATVNTAEPWCTCYTPATWNPASNWCDCPIHFMWLDYGCLYCPAGSDTSDQSVCQCDDPDKSFSVYDLVCKCDGVHQMIDNKCVSCPKDVTSNGVDCMCANNYIFIKDRYYCECNGNNYIFNRYCQPCPEKSTPSSDFKTCKCNSGKFENNICVYAIIAPYYIVGLVIAAVAVVFASVWFGKKLCNRKRSKNGHEALSPSADENIKVAQ